MNDKKLLLESIFNKTGIYISTKNDCRIISQFIVNEKVGFLSESTLYRFFLYPSHTSKPYKNTYNVLAKFCGYPDWNTFLQYYDSNQMYNDPKFINHSINIVIENFVVNENFNPLIEIYNTLEKENYKTKEFFGVKTFLNFQKTNLFPKFIKEHGDHPYVRSILIESLFDPYHRMNGYSEGLENYMLKTNKQSKDYMRDLIFSQAVLFRNYYLKTNDKAIEIGKKLYEDPIWEAEINKLHIFPKIRFMAYKFWYLYLKFNGTAPLQEYSAYFKDWIQNEIKNTETIHELNIIYHTTREVLQNLNLKELDKDVKKLFDARISNQYAHHLEFDKLYNPNGIISVIPL